MALDLSYQKRSLGVLCDMDLSDPTRAVTATLDGTVLAVLAVAGRPLTVGQVARQAVRGSEIGIRRSLARLVEQGIVRATWMGRNQVHELNREHVAAEVAVLLAGLRSELWRRLREELGSWRVRPLYAGVFGSAARGDGDVDSDIDLLLVHPPFVGESQPDTAEPASSPSVVEAVDSAVLSSGEPDPALQWQAQTDRLRGLVLAWTGNPLQIVDLSFRDWRRPPTQYQPLLDEVRREGVQILAVPGPMARRSVTTVDA